MRENSSDLFENPTYANPTYPRFTVLESRNVAMLNDEDSGEEC